jgi:hypothetical protein
MNSVRPIRALGAAAALSALLGVTRCTAEVYPPAVGGYTTVYATNVPPDMTVYPRVAYAGGYAYLVGNRWYYPHQDRWVVLQQEPPELYRYRARYVAPPVYRAAPVYAPRQYAPPVQYGYPPPPVQR